MAEAASMRGTVIPSSTQTYSLNMFMDGTMTVVGIAQVSSHRFAPRPCPG